MCKLFKYIEKVYCQQCRTEVFHIKERTVNCKKAKYRCCLCGHSNGIRT